MLAACGGDEPSTPTIDVAAAGNDASVSAARDQRAAAARTRVDALLGEPGPATLLATLAQGHAEARALLGPHHLRYKASFSLKPEIPTRPVVDEPIQQDMQVIDELVLAWGSRPGEPVRMHLTQKTDKAEGREVVILDEQVYTRLAHRGWFTRALDSELHGIWLDEAQHSVHDIVELAAPVLAVAAEESGDSVALTLSHSGVVDPSRIVAGHGREWRQRAEITDVSGTITLGRSDGLWRTAELTVRYTLRDTQDRLQRGETQLTATSTAAAEVVVTAPEQAQPAPERIRPETERQRLLGGLAGT